MSEVQQQLAAGKATRTSAYILPKTLCKSGSIETEPITKRSKPRRTLVVDGYTYVKGNRGNRLYNLRELHDASDMRGDYSGSIRSIPTLHSLIAAMNEAVK